MLLGMADSFRSCDVACTTDLKQVSTHQHRRRQGDMFFPDQLLAKSNLPVVADLSICHPFPGDGQWRRDAAQVRVKEKIKKHSASYATNTDQQAHFTLLVATTYGRLEDDFLRLLWLIGAKATEDGRSVGEIREYAAIKDYRQQIFARLCAQASITIARYTTARVSSLIPSPPSTSVHAQRLCSK